jgi:alkanesulfonate monooxygenase SsuD/methylene tetrahydromethanopterin reductase-like flavin-dependent oxidoreductase (luciferase family)
MTDTMTTFDARRGMYTANKLKLGLFCQNASGARLMTKVPERWSGSWEDNVKLSRMCDDAGIDFLLPIARWKGYPGETNFQCSTFETLTWATGILALTKNITVFATVHVPLVNPIAAAKMLVTADHVGQGRVGLNIVVGWNEDEFGMFGVPQRPEADRYPYAQEWIDVVKRIWTETDEFDFDGKFLHMKNVEGNPKLIGAERPLMMNAGTSPAGRVYAITNCDAFFTSTGMMTFDEVAGKVETFKREARSYGRELDVFSDGIVVCRPTQEEAEEYFHYAAIENADWEGVELRLNRRATSKKSIAPGAMERADFEIERERWIKGVVGRNMIGDPDSVARQLADLHFAGLSGMALNFVNYLDELPYFRAEVLPRLERMGLRTKVRATA